MRSDSRSPDQLRPVKMTTGYLQHPDGSCLIEMGNTRIICSAMLEETVPPFLKGSGKGWLTAEYSMLPASSAQRIRRERQSVGGRTQEIQRLIGRALRSCIDLSALGERSVLVDCDVLDADGGTRTAAITGAYVALSLGVRKWSATYPVLKDAIKLAVAAVSVGIVDGQPVLDLHYDDDKRASVDMNIVKTSDRRFVEVQGTAEGHPFDDGELNTLLKLASQGIDQLFQAQKQALAR